MKISGAVLISGLLAAAVQATPQGTTSAPAPTVSETPQQICLGKCNPGDVNCQAACITVPAPNQSMANDTHDCAAKCNQGSGSPADTQAYANCVQGCISSFFYSTGSAAPAGQTGLNSGSPASATGSAATGTVKGSNGASATGSSSTVSGSAAAKATGAANGLQVGTSFAGVAGIIAAIFAL